MSILLIKMSYSKDFKFVFELSPKTKLIHAYVIVIVQHLAFSVWETKTVKPSEMPPRNREELLCFSLWCVWPCTSERGNTWGNNTNRLSSCSIGLLWFFTGLRKEISAPSSSLYESLFQRAGKHWWVHSSGIVAHLIVSQPSGFPVIT